MYDWHSMRRVLSICLVFILGFGPLSAAVQANDDDSRLPACCRRHGTHHCAMSDSMVARMVAAASGQPTLTATSHCPLYPNGSCVPNNGVRALADSSNDLPVLLAQEHSHVSAIAAARPNQLRTRADRGPPASNIA
jgi:hypothetical protein